MLFDSHAHINNEAYSEKERENLIRAIEDSKLSYVMDVGFDLGSSLLACNHANKYDWCYAAVGFHPHNADKMSEEDLAFIRGLAKKPKVQAIGEIGLDYYRNISDPEVQRYWFRRQLQLALDLSVPVVIHDRDANADVMRILKEEGVFDRARIDKFPNKEDGLPDARLLLHCYSGSREMALQYLKLGATISIAGPVTYKNARRLLDVVDAVPVSHLLIETDAPYLTPEPLRGKANQSPYVEHVARKVAEIKGLSFEEVAAKTCDNAKRFFGIE